MYNNHTFEKRYGINIYKYISKITELDKNSDEYNNYKKLLDKPVTYGRKTGILNKRLNNK